MNHIGDANKMISETPRMRAAQQAAMEHMTGDVWRVGCDIERELNAANERIKRLEEAGDGLFKIAEKVFHSGGEDMYWIRLLEDELPEWKHAKEAKP